MLLRKSRKHLHGASNRTLNSSKFQQHTRQISTASAKTFKDSFLKKSSAISFFPRKILMQRQGNKTEIGQQIHQKPQFLRVTQAQLRKKYRGCKNISKVLNRWGFTGKGCISREQFKQQLSKKIGQSFNNEQADQLFESYCETDNEMNVQGLISLLFGKTEGIPFDYRIFSTKEDNIGRTKLVQDLKQNIKNFQPVQKKEINDISINNLITKINSAISMMKQQQMIIPENKESFFQEVKNLKKFTSFQKDMLDHLEKSMNFKQMRTLTLFDNKADNLLADPLARKIRKSPLDCENSKISNFEAQTTQTLFHKMRTSPNFFSTLCSQDKRKQFGPLTLTNINQGKTRFQRSIFTSQSSGWRSNIHSESICPNQKEIVANQLRKQQEISKTRYQNKLKKINAWHQKQSQSIASRQFDTQKTEQGRLQRIRNQQEAYTYINFIKKKWE